MKVLIVTYVFPPALAVGAYRILKFCKYLIRNGIEPYILTPEFPNTMARDESSVKLIPDGVKILRTFTLEPFRVKPVANKISAPSPSENRVSTIKSSPSLISSLKQIIKSNISIPDTSYFWIWCGLLPGIRLVNLENIDIVISSSPPHAVHVLGSRIARQTGRPHIVDFRDLWTQNTSYHERKLPDYLKQRDRRFELKVLKRAAAVTVNTGTFKRQLLEKNKFLDDSQIEVITNGVDSDDFKGLLSDSAPLPNDKFTMLYTGSLYGDHRNPEFFFEAMRFWIDQNPDIESKLRATFIGNWTPQFHGLIDKYNLGNIIDKKGWMPQDEALKATFSADLLLLFQGFDPVLAAAIPRKLFEYMITNKPILAFAPPGEIPQLIDEYNCGVCLSEKNREPIVSFLSKSFEKWKVRAESGRMESPALRSMPKLETSAQVHKLAELLMRLIPKK